MAPRSRPSHALATVYPSRARPTLPWEAASADEEYGKGALPDWRAIDWRRHLGDVQVGGRRMRYVALGEGERPPVVFIHGLGGNWQSWLENLPRVATERRAIAMDLPGFGASETPADTFTISGCARWVDEFCDRLGLGQVALVGNSMGGFIGAEMAISYPERVEALVLAAAAGISVSSLRRRPIMTAARLGAVIGALTAARTRQFVARPHLRHLALCAVVRHPSRLSPELVYEITQSAGSPSVRPALDALLSYDFSDRLPDIRCPTLLVWGTEDVLVPVEDAEEFERLIPRVHKHILGETGHVPMLERPRTFNEALMDFLESSGAGEERAEARQAAS